MAIRREDRVGDEIKRLLASLIQRDLKDPRVPAFTSLTQVDVTRDFSYATCYVSVLGTPEVQKEAIVALNNSKGFLRSSIAKQIRLRTTPELKFVLDDTFDRAEKINRLIDEAMGRSQES